MRPDPGGQLNLSDSPGLTPFHHLIQAQTAFNALPYCSWGDLSVGATEAPKRRRGAERQKALAVNLGAQVAMYQRQFDIYKATLSQAGVERRQAYGEWYMNATEVTGGGFFGPSQFGLELAGDVWELQQILARLWHGQPKSERRDDWHGTAISFTIAARCRGQPHIGYRADNWHGAD